MKQYLFAPGPAPVPPDVLLEMARPMIHHRTPEFSGLLDSVRERLKPLFGTRQEIILLASSGTGAMEAAVCNLLDPGNHALYVNGGKFGERWGKLIVAHGAIAHEVKVEWGRSARPEDVDDALTKNPTCRAVFVQASETSTGALHPIAEIGEVTRRRGVLLIVDGITSVGVFEQEMDGWGVDALVTGSQKALMLPPGLAMIALSAQAWARVRESHARRYYFDLQRELKAQRDEHTTAYTPAVALLFGLNKALEMIEAETLPHVFARQRMMAEATRAAALPLGLRIFADSPAPGVTAMAVPDGVDSGKLVRYMRDELGVSIQGGQDQMKGKLLRIGHMGYLSPFDMLTAVSALELALARQGHDFEPGAGVSAVQKRIKQGI
ncbi:MAG TPA: alanine--glyoxylate aminotransferase family protein [Candidatus Binataceae bacterium]|nr:alanine--glyoxylate aminotransferase family protein [Candidatus Binataceae bacterium]